MRHSSAPNGQQPASRAFPEAVHALAPACERGAKLGFHRGPRAGRRIKSHPSAGNRFGPRCGPPMFFALLAFGWMWLDVLGGRPGVDGLSPRNGASWARGPWPIWFGTASFVLLGLSVARCALRQDRVAHGMSIRESPRSWPRALRAGPVLLAQLVGGLLLYHLGGWETLALLGGLCAAYCALVACFRPAFVFPGIFWGGVLPWLGSTGLFDPWETHYGEVAREILARSDWMSLWWAQDGWFWSKPVLIFWVQAWLRGAFGVPFAPNVWPAGIEAVLRLGPALLALGLALAAFATMRLYAGTRAGLAAGLVMLTAPLFWLISQHAVTDTYFVAGVTLALAAMLAALHPSSAGRRAGTLGLGVGGLFFAVTAAQGAYLIGRNLRLGAPAQSTGGASQEGVLRASGQWAYLVRDTFYTGSPGNADMLGNAPWEVVPSAFGGWLDRTVGAWATPVAEPALLGVATLASALWLLGAWLGPRRIQNGTRSLRQDGSSSASQRDALLFAFYTCCGLGLLAKGLPGVALPGLVMAIFIGVGRRWHALLRGDFAVLRGTATVCVLALPWYLTMITRHGLPFINRFFVHDHLKRLAGGVHGETGDLTYYIEQLALGFFPWSAIVPWTCICLLRSGPQLTPEERLAREFLVTWALTAFALFTLTATKFHHYILPVIPPLAWLVGWRFAAAVGAAKFASRKGVDISRSCLRRGEGYGERWALSAAALVGGLVLLGVLTRNAAGVSGQGAFLSLFTYTYQAVWPPALDLRLGLGLTAAVALAGVLFAQAVPTRASWAFAASLVFCIWLSRGYLPPALAHRSQAALIARYMVERENETVPLFAYQHYWMGENFYTGNHLHAPKTLEPEPLSTWVKAHAGEVAYFILERKRLERLQRWLSPRILTELVPQTTHHTHTLVRARL